MDATDMRVACFAITSEIAKRVRETHARPEDWLNEKFVEGIVRAHSNSVLQRYFEGRLDLRPHLPDELTKDERNTLEWLSEEDYSQYGECYGTALDMLVLRGFVTIHGPGEHQNFIAQDPTGTKGIMYLAVSLTDAGIAKAKELREAKP